jgi:signal transduction histidine kinase
MPQHYFKFAARVLEHLGAELISSDDVALYELVKNGFDASIGLPGPALVRVDVDYQLAVDRVAEWRGALEGKASAGPRLYTRDEVLEALPAQSPPTESELRVLRTVLPSRASIAEMRRAFGAANRIVISDSGVGMGLEDFDKHFLTVGTTHRLQQVRDHMKRGNDSDGVLPTGEKGIGRLSMMRLGSQAEIRSSKRGEDTEQCLQIDWRRFSADQTEQAQTIPVDLRSGPRRSDSPVNGTTITITDLRSAWDQTKTREVAQRFLSKFLDPFQKGPRRREVQITWNGIELEVPRVGRVFLDAAHNGFRARVKRTSSGNIDVHVARWFTTESGLRKETTRTYSQLDFGGIDPVAFASVGPFDVEFFHYNRRRLKAIPGVATRDELKEWLDEWCGGLKLYRDGIRVMPYGQAPPPPRSEYGVVQRSSDDWLALDSAALRGRGFRVNRIQVVGCVRISRMSNPELRDQANREGLIENPASRHLVAILKALVAFFVSDLDEIGRPKEGDFEQLHDAAVTSQEDFEKAVEDLVDAATSDDRRRVKTARERVRACLDTLRAVIDDTQLALQERQLNRIEVIELAATGIAAEAFAHDLEASIDHAMEHTAVATKESGRDSPLAATLMHLRVVLKSLRIQISSIKPGPAKHRRRKSEFDIAELLVQVEAFYRARLDRHSIVFRVEARPKGSSFRVNAVEGHVRQVLDNLIRNSIYWLKQTRIKAPDKAGRAEIRVVLDARSGSVSFSDSGIGIAPEDADWVFGRFNSRRERGRGLGLYISRELCDFNSIRLELDSKGVNQWGRLAAFVLDFGDGFVGASR